MNALAPRPQSIRLLAISKVDQKEIKPGFIRQATPTSYQSQGGQARYWLKNQLDILRLIDHTLRPTPLYYTEWT